MKVIVQANGADGQAGMVAEAVRETGKRRRCSAAVS